MSTVHELRASSTDRSQRKGDITAKDLHEDGLPTILDVGITYPLVDTNITNKSTVERGFAANRYATRKNDNANATIDNGSTATSPTTSPPSLRHLWRLRDRHLAPYQHGVR